MMAQVIPFRRDPRAFETRPKDKHFTIIEARAPAREVQTPPSSPVISGALADEVPDPIHWPSLCAGAVLELAAGLLAVAVPAIIVARLYFGEWL